MLIEKYNIVTNLIHEMLKAGSLRTIVGVVLDGEVGKYFPRRLVPCNFEALRAHRRFVFDRRRCDQRDAIHITDFSFLLKVINY